MILLYLLLDWMMLFCVPYFVSIKSIPYRAIGALLFWCCCCYSRCFCHPYSVLFFEMCDYFCSIFDSSISSFCRRCLSLLVVVVAGYVLMTIYASWPPLEIDRTLSWDCFDWFFLITGITRTSFVVVPCKLLSFLFFVPPCCCSFCSMLSTCVVRSFRQCTAN